MARSLVDRKTEYFTWVLIYYSRARDDRARTRNPRKRPGTSPVAPAAHRFWPVFRADCALLTHFKRAYVIGGLLFPPPLFSRGPFFISPVKYDFSLSSCPCGYESFFFFFFLSWWRPTSHKRSLFGVQFVHRNINYPIPSKSKVTDDSRSVFVFHSASVNGQRVYN